MKATSIVIAAFVLLGGSGCAATTSRAMQSWVGSHYSDLLISWGPPQQVFDDRSGGRVLVWIPTRSSIPAPATTRTNFNMFAATAYDNEVWRTAASRTVYDPARTSAWTTYRMFWIGRDGRIYRWASKER